MYKLIQITTVVFLFTGSALAQQLSGFGEENLRELGGEGDDIEMVQTYDDRYSGIQGSPFFLDEWEYGQVLAINNTIFDSVQVKYDLFKDRLLYRYKVDTNEVIKVANSDRVKAFAIYDHDQNAIYQFKRFEYLPPSSDSPQVGFFQVIDQEGQQYLLLKREAFFNEANYRGAYNYGKTYDEFNKEQQYYVLKDDQKLHKLNNNKKSVLKAFEDEKKSVKKYIRDHDLNFDNKRELLMVFDYYSKIKD